MLKKSSLFLCFWLMVVVLFAQNNGQLISLKIAFLPHFAENITWENERDFDYFRIGYLGNNLLVEKNMQEMLKSYPKMKKKQVIFQKFKSIEEIQDVPFLFVDEEYNDDLIKICQKTASTQTLLVTTECVYKREVMINLFQKGNGVAFEVNKATIFSKGLYVLPDLLLRGGSEIDIAEIYTTAQKMVAYTLDSLKKEKDKGKLYEKEINFLLADIAQNKEKLKQQEQKIAKQLVSIEHQKKELEITKSEYLQTQTLLLAQNNEIQLRQQQLAEQEVELFAKKKKLADYNRKLAMHTNKIDEQEEEIFTQQQVLNNKQKLINLQEKTLWITVVAGILVSILGFIIFIGYQNKQKINQKLREQAEIIEQKNHTLGEQAEELLLMNTNLNSQNIQLVKANEQIQDSIHYASRLQQSILPSFKKSIFNESMFLIYKPMYVLSGDFYFRKDVDNQCFIAIVDCTGHSVPGALLSMLGYNSLNEIIGKGIYDPGQILNELHKRVINVLVDIEDGMDISLCRIDKKTQQLDFAGAKNPLLYYDKKGKQQIVKGGIISIGGMIDFDRNYKTITIPLHQISSFYLFSDGYQDQFGGQKDKKITRKKFYELLTVCQGKKMSEQQLFLEQFFEKWKENTQQTDDVTILGVTLS